MEKGKLDIIVKHFTELYDEEIRNNEVTGDCINEWWVNTRDQYGYDSDEASEVYPEIEKAIFKAIWRINMNRDINRSDANIIQLYTR